MAALRVAEHAAQLPDELRDVPVPPLLLQPLVENAIRHGLEPKVGPGRLIVRARRQGGALLLEVRDTGVGLRSNDKSTGAATFGIEHVRARLRTVYGDAATLTLQEAADEDGAHGGATAIVRLPLPHSTSSPNVPAGAPMPVHREPLQP
jgi:LytS/YehU family sensor histidine kinase